MGKRKTRKTRVYNLTERSPLVSETRPDIKETLKFVAPYIWPKTKMLQVLAVMALMCTICGKLANLAIPLMLKNAVDALTPGMMDGKKAGIAVVMYASLRFVQIILTQMQNYSWRYVSLDQTRRFSVATFAHLHALSMSYHLKRRTGEVLRVMDRGVSSLGSLQSLFAFTIGPTIFELILVCTVFLRLNTPFVALATFISVILYGFFSVYVTNWRIQLRRKLIEVDNAVSDRATDSLLNFETVKYFGAENTEVKQYSDRLAEYQNASLKTQLWLGILNSGQSFIVNLGVASSLLITIYRAVNGDLTAGDFVMVNAYIRQLYGPLNWLGNAYKTVTQASTDLEKMVELSLIPQEVEDKPGAPPIRMGAGEVRFENVSFDYGPNAGGSLSEISFTIQPGRMTAIVGPTGSGKSTIVKLLLRLYDVKAGRILIDGQDIRDVQQSSLRQAIGVVAQETVLFNDTIRVNVSYGNPDADDAMIKEALKAAQLTEFVARQSGGLETEVGERGLRLSGGEKQRVGIARMVLKDPKIVLLDEATSALDTNTERAVQSALQSISTGRTSLAIAHRLSTIVDADEILVLDRGKIVERGTHEELLCRGTDSQYYRMWKTQNEKPAATVLSASPPSPSSPKPIN